MKPQHPNDPAALRRAAETRLKQRPASSRPRTEADLRRLQHELEVHQIELGMQNEELRAAHAEAAAALERYTDLYDFAPIGYLTLDRQGTIVAANLMGAHLLGLDRADVLQRRLALFVTDADRPAFHAFLEKTFTSGTRESCEVTLPRQEGSTLLIMHLEAVASLDRLECRAAMLDVSERHQAGVERDRSIEELQEALARVKQLSGLLPICSSCKKIRDDQGYWKQVEAYISSHSEATFTHGLCPDCIHKFYPGFEDNLDKPTSSDTSTEPKSPELPRT